MARRMRGYNDAQARQIFRDLIDMPADVAITDDEITAALSSPSPSPHRPRLRTLQQTRQSALVERARPPTPPVAFATPLLGQFRSVEIQASDEGQTPHPVHHPGLRAGFTDRLASSAVRLPVPSREP